MATPLDRSSIHDRNDVHVIEVIPLPAEDTDGMVGTLLSPNEGTMTFWVQSDEGCGIEHIEVLTGRAVSAAAELSSKLTP